MLFVGIVGYIVERIIAECYVMVVEWLTNLDCFSFCFHGGILGLL